MLSLHFALRFLCDLASPEGEHMPQIPEPGVDEPRRVVNRQNARSESACFVRQNSLLMYCNIWILLSGWAKSYRLLSIAWRGRVLWTRLMARKSVIPETDLGRWVRPGTLLQRQIVLDNYSDPLVLFLAFQDCTRVHSRMKDRKSVV